MIVFVPITKQNMPYFSELEQQWLLSFTGESADETAWGSRRPGFQCWYWLQVIVFFPNRTQLLNCEGALFFQKGCVFAEDV